MSFTFGCHAKPTSVVTSPAGDGISMFKITPRYKFTCRIVICWATEPNRDANGLPLICHLLCSRSVIGESYTYMDLINFRQRQQWWIFNSHKRERIVRRRLRPPWEHPCDFHRVSDYPCRDPCPGLRHGHATDLRELDPPVAAHWQVDLQRAIYCSDPLLHF